MDYSIGTLLFNLIITAIFYLIVPFILSKTIMKNNKYTAKTIKLIGIGNAVVVFIVCRVIQYINLGDSASYSFAPAFIWGAVGISIMTTAAKKNNNLVGDERKNNLVKRLNKEAKERVNGLSDEDFDIKGAEGTQQYGHNSSNPIFTKNVGSYFSRIITSDGKPITYTTLVHGKCYSDELGKRVKVHRVVVSVDNEYHGDLYITWEGMDVDSNIYPTGYKFSEKKASSTYGESVLNTNKPESKNEIKTEQKVETKVEAKKPITNSDTISSSVKFAYSQMKPEMKKVGPIKSVEDLQTIVNCYAEAYNEDAQQYDKAKCVRIMSIFLTVATTYYFKNKGRQALESATESCLRKMDGTVTIFDVSNTTNAVLKAIELTKDNAKVEQTIKQEAKKLNESNSKPVKKTVAVKSEPKKADDKIPAEQLKKLKELHDEGILTDEEFAEKKKKVLGI